MLSRLLCAATTAALALGCSESAGPAAPRSYLMGFSAIPPRFDTALVVQGITMWAGRADAAIIHASPPWEPLINGVATPAQAVTAIELPLVNLYRSLGLAIVITADPTDGLDRAAEHPDLVRLGRSVTDTMIQRIYREWVIALAQQLQPDYLGLVAETNLIRALAPAAVYQALVTMANAAVPRIRAASAATRLYVSVQVEVAWGRPSGPYQGIATDRSQFPFVDAIGLSSYPYLGGFAQPEDLPLDYYSRVAQGTTLPVLVVEGGWPSSGYGSSPAMQARFVARQAELLDRAQARGVFQLTFFDLAGAALPGGGNLGPFIHLGLADSAMNAKPALAAWDELFVRPRQP